MKCNSTVISDETIFTREHEVLARSKFYFLVGTLTGEFSVLLSKSLVTGERLSVEDQTHNNKCSA